MAEHMRRIPMRETVEAVSAMTADWEEDSLAALALYLRALALPPTENRDLLVRGALGNLGILERSAGHSLLHIFLSYFDLLDHGTALRYPWTSERGKALCDWLAKHGTNRELWDDAAGWDE